MCGIVGILEDPTLEGTPPDRMRHEAARMARTLSHRGPDDRGTWVDGEGGIALGFARLAIQDLSPAGRQPMHSASGRYIIVFNGEIYNFRELRRELEQDWFRTQAAAKSFVGGSDTEVLLAAIEQWGVEEAIGRAAGMFGLAVWDRRERTLHLGRDRIGEKPLYYGWLGRSFVFASELKAIRLHAFFEGTIDPQALGSYLRHGCIPGPRSIYRGIYKLPPATLLTLRADALAPGWLPRPAPYWSAMRILEGADRARPLRSAEEAVEALDPLLRRVIRQQMIADVPVGAFLSGGIDSSTVVALMQLESSRPVRTFSIGFDVGQYDEAPYARAVAEHLGTEHTELYVTSQEALEVIPRLADLYDEPFADSTQIPTYLLAKMARARVTVCLSGDGGDELFGGYSRYLLAELVQRRLGWVPGKVRMALGRRVRRLPLVRSSRSGSLGRKLFWLGQALAAPTLAQFHDRMMTHPWHGTSCLRMDVAGPVAGEEGLLRAQVRSWARQMMHHDLVTYLPDDLLVKVDRATMAHGLENRAPLLDPRVVEFALRLPTSQLLEGRVGKSILRQLLYRHVPRRLVDRPKMGFSVPVGSWLCGKLRPWAEELLDERRLRQEGFFDPAPITRKWREHLAGRASWSHDLWYVLMFEAWLDAEKGRGRTSAMAA